MALFSRLKTRNSGDIIIGADDDADLDNIINNLKADKIVGSSANITAMQVTVDPYPGASESLAAHQEGENHRMRYLFKQQHITSQFYIFPDLVTKTTTYIASQDDRVILCDTSGGAWTLTLPPASGLKDKILYIKKITSDVNILTIDGNGAETIDGAATQSLLAQYSSYVIVCDGSNWFILMSDVGTLFSAEHKTTTGTHKTLSRAQFAHTDDDTITIGAAGYEHNGTVHQRVFWDSIITFEAGRPGAGGSNTDNTALGNNEWHYFYIDDSAVVTLGDNELTASEFLNSTTVPTWSNAKRGWYNGSDRCIFAMRTGGSGNLHEFFHEDSLVIFADAKGIDIGNSGSDGQKDVDTTWLDVDFPAGSANLCPAFTTRINIFAEAADQADVNPTKFFWKTKGQGGTVGHRLGLVVSTIGDQDIVTDVITDSSGVFQVKANFSGPQTLEIAINGWYFGMGM